MPITSGRYQSTGFNPLDPAPTKVCKKCKEEKDRKEFKTNSTSRDGKDSMCCTCRDESNRQKGRRRAEKRREDNKYFM